MGMLSFAQNFEDVMLWRPFKDVKQGFYIDVGANHPVSDSVTKWFYEQGWSGINIEPSEKFYRLLLQDRKRDINIRKIVGASKGGGVIFYEIPDSGLSTIVEDIAIQHKNEGLDIHETEIEMTTLNDICDEYVSPKDKIIHFLKIDVEGAEFEVIKGINLKKYRPYIMILEVGWNISWENYLINQQYEFLYFDGINRFYVAKEVAEKIKPFFTSPVNVLDGYALYSNVYLQQMNLQLRNDLIKVSQENERLKNAISNFIKTVSSVPS